MALLPARSTPVQPLSLHGQELKIGGGEQPPQSPVRLLLRLVRAMQVPTTCLGGLDDGQLNDDLSHFGLIE
ncbi:hypothetical protein EDB83DRAFT_2408575, partial [Lactarius deliciosus]